MASLFNSIIVIIAIISLRLKQIVCLDRDFTIVLNAMEKQCFYEKIEPNFIIDIEYQVCYLIY